jgi:hypothetical protein
MIDDTPQVETRAKKVGSVLMMVVIWVFVGAIAYQQLSTPITKPKPTPLSQLALYVNRYDEVFLMVDGVSTQQVSLAECSQRRLDVTFSDTLMLSYADMPTWAVQNGITHYYEFNIPQESLVQVVSSNIGTVVSLKNDNHINMGIVCPPNATEVNRFMVMMDDRVVYLTDLSSNDTSVLFQMEDNCSLSWTMNDKSQIFRRGHLADSSNDNSGQQTFTFTLEGDIQMAFTKRDAVTFEADNGFVTLGTFCSR